MNALQGLKIGMISLGCVKNRVDSEQMLGRLTQAGMEITHEPREADVLIDELLSLDNPYHCPHGRPTIISMSKSELERKFHRII